MRSAGRAGKTYLIPAVPAFVKEIDVDGAAYLRVRLHRGHGEPMHVPYRHYDPLSTDAVGDMVYESILGRGPRSGTSFASSAHQIRDYTTNKQNQVDDYPYGGGHGARHAGRPALSLLVRTSWTTCPRRTAHTIYTVPLRQDLSTRRMPSGCCRDYDHLILVCGHYEGIDQRFIEECVDEEISHRRFCAHRRRAPGHGGGGRRVPAGPRRALGPGLLHEDESHWNGLLEYPQYSRAPRSTWHDRRVPPILLSGHHANVEKWRRKQSIIRTRDRRPDMYAKLDLSSKADQKLLKGNRAG